ncbi:MAG TPA: protein-glutamate O-methyltransferase CheR [Tepidisphaeraceae bacterium]|nr:protein-glutamate O-methyltransferase CheR [Tepidisphaeraceae bacterium]
MESLSPDSAAFRHVIFPEFAGGPPVNFTAADGHRRHLPVVPSSAGAIEEQAFLRWLFEQADLDCGDYKMETLRRRVPSCLRALRAASLSDARQILQRNPALVKVAVNSLVIGVTSFFRDSNVFDTLATEILPELTSRGSNTRIWSVGCSDGAELYSVAMLLAERDVLHRCYLLGTDCRSDAVKRASDGIYDADAMKNMPNALTGKYFVRDGNKSRIVPWMRTQVQWRSANVLEVQEPGGWDMILCRNLAIYLRADAAGKLWQKLLGSLRPGGVLVLGKAERPLPAEGVSVIGPSVFCRNRS